MPAAELYRLDPIEMAVGWVPGYVTTRVGQLSAHRASPRAVLDDLLRAALLGAPCVVSFSGGRDSSIILAAATVLARREGLADPVPVTRWHRDLAATDEEQWQRRVIDHLGLTEWARLLIDDAVDLVGPYAQRVLRRHGVVWPSAAHVLLPIFDHLSAGTVLTGEGGDEVFGDHRVTGLTRVLAGDLSRRAMREAVGTVAPRRARVARALRRIDTIRPSWVRDAAWAHLRPRLASDAIDAPLHLSASLRRLLRRRAWTIGRATLDRLADDSNVRLVHPFLEPSYVDALAGHLPPWGFPDRTSAFEALFADLLPADVLRRTTKAVFNAALFNEHATAFAARWDGCGVVHELVDPKRLKDEWLSEYPSALSGPLLQAAWLHASSNDPAV